MCVTGWDGWQDNSLYSLQCISNVGVIKTTRTSTDPDGVLYMYCTHLRAVCTQKIRHLYPWYLVRNSMCVGVVLVQTLVFYHILFCVLTCRANASIYIWSFKVCRRSCTALGILSRPCWTMRVWISCSNNLYKPDDGLHVRLLLKHNFPCYHLVNMSSHRSRLSLLITDNDH